MRKTRIQEERLFKKCGVKRKMNNAPLCSKNISMDVKNRTIDMEELLDLIAKFLEVSRRGAEEKANHKRSP